MALTLLESAKYTKDAVRKGVVKVIVEKSPILQYLTVRKIDSASYVYNIEQSLPGIAFRGVNETWPRSTGVINPVTERTVIMGGELFIDNYQIATSNGKNGTGDLKAVQFDMKARALAMVFSEYFFEGDSEANVKVFDGLKVRLTGNQAIEAGANGAALTLNMLDQLEDAVVGDSAEKHYFMNKTVRRKLMHLARDFTSYPLVDVGHDALGKRVTQYNGNPIHVIEREDLATSFLGFDETTGSSNVTASVYLLRFGDPYIYAIQSGGDMTVKDFGELEAETGHMGRLEWYVGLCVPHPRAGARLYGLLDA